MAETEALIEEGRSDEARLKAKQEGLPLASALMEAQEMTGKIGGVPYWEGACDVLDEKGNKVGVAYLELAGYVEGLAERLR